MPNTQFTLKQGHSRELECFPHIREFSLRKNSTIQLDSFAAANADDLCLYFISEGKFEWVIDGRYEVLFPGDTAVILPGQEVGGANGYLNIGTYCCLRLVAADTSSDGAGIIGDWSGLSEVERLAIGRILRLNNLPVLKGKEVGGCLQDLSTELFGRELGFATRANHILDNLLITVARQSTQQANSRRDFPQVFMKLERALRQNLSHQWTVEEMAALVGLGTTAFTEKVKNYTGFPPLHYLINIRISEAIKLLKKPGANVTAIALDTGFYCCII